MHHCSTGELDQSIVGSQPPIWVGEPVESHPSGVASDLVSLEKERSTGLASSLGKPPDPNQQGDASSRTGVDPVDRSACQLSQYPDVPEETVWHAPQLGKHCGDRAGSRATGATVVEPATGEHTTQLGLG